jgi:hypothetical protein
MKRGLDRARCLGHAPADRVVRSLAASGAIGQANATLATLVRNDSPLPEGMRPGLRRFLERDSALPEWTDCARVRRAQGFAQRNAVPITVALFHASLPTAFAAAKGALVLEAGGSPGDIVRFFDRRALRARTPGDPRVAGGGRGLLSPLAGGRKRGLRSWHSR